MDVAVKALSLMYHDVVEHGSAEASGFAGPAAAEYKLEREEFARHLDAIELALPGTPSRTIARADQCEAGHPVFLTFDDGGVGAYTTIAPLLERRSWRGHFFVTTSYVGRPGFLTADQIRALHERGHSIGSHSHSHPAWMASCSDSDLAREWVASAQILADILGEPARVASVPGGDYSRRVGAAIAGAGFDVLFTSRPTTRIERIDNCLVVGRYVLRRGVRPEVAAGLVAGRRFPRLKQSLMWRAKRMVKSVARPLLRQTSLGRTVSPARPE